MGKTYFLDLHTLLTYLQKQACVLTTELLVAGKASTGQVVVRDGVIKSCLIRSQDGTRIEGNQAYQQLQTCTKWQVELERQEETRVFPPTQLSPAPAPFLPIPSYPWSESAAPGVRQPLRQKRALDVGVLQNLPVKQRLNLRMVFTMINGQRSAEEIKALLHLPPDVVDEILSRLRILDVIE